MTVVPPAIRVYVVDDHPVVRQGLLAVLSREDDVDVVGHAGSSDLALCELATTPVDVVVIDHRRAGDLSGLSVLERLSQPPYSLHCLVLTAGVSPDDLRSLVATGVGGVVSKSSETHLIVAAVRSVAAGHHYFDHHVLQALVHRQDEPLSDAFDARDRLVLGYLADGLSNRQIAQAMHVSSSSVKKYVSTVLRKLGVAHRTSAIAAAAARGLLRDRATDELSSKSGHLATPFVATRAYAPMVTSR